MLDWKPEWGEIRCYKASVIAEKLGCTIAEARELKAGFVLDHVTKLNHVSVNAPIESEADNGSK